jgi:hypothetical protein
MIMWWLGKMKCWQSLCADLCSLINLPAAFFFKLGQQFRYNSGGKHALNFLGLHLEWPEWIISVVAIANGRFYVRFQKLTISDREHTMRLSQ